MQDLQSPNQNDPTSGIDWLIANQQAAAAKAVSESIDADPDKAARAIELGKSTGVDPAAIYPDTEQFEEQHRAQLTHQIISNNPALQDYVNSHPLAASVSSDDWGQLDTISSKLHRWATDSILSAPSDAGAAAVEGFYKSFTAEGKLGQWAVRDQDAQFAAAHPFLYRNLVQSLQLLGAPIEVFNRTISGIIGGAGAGLQSVGRSAGLDEDSVKRLPEDVASLADAAMQTQMGMHVPEVADASVLMARQRMLSDVYKSVRPYLENGEKPPIGLHPVIDQIYHEQAKADIDALSDLLSEAQKSATRDRAPGLFEDFVRAKSDQTIGISAEAVRKLYGDKVPEADDNILGFIPDLAKQLEAAEAYGGDVEVPLASWLARVDPEVAKQLEGDIRVRKGGVTLNETDSLVSAAERPGFDAWHGSPHDFEKFDIGKIGTGEGAQDYGYGLYFAEEPAVARSYQQKIETTGNLYKVRINADREHFLDWDKPLNEQSEHVQRALRALGVRLDKRSGERAYYDIGKLPDNAPLDEHKALREKAGKNATQILREAGIPGIKYLDAGSREAKKGTSNFVVFDNKLIQTTHKNNRPIDIVDAIRRSAGLNPSFAPEQFRLVRVPREADDEPNFHQFDFENAEGKRIGGGTLTESPDGKTLKFDHIAAGTTQGTPGFLGQRQVLGLLRQLQEEFPNARTLEGWRIAGAREKPEWVSIPLRPSKQQITDFMRSGYAPQTIRTSGGQAATVQPIYSTTVGASVTPEAIAKVTDSPIIKYFGQKILELAKDVPIHVISRADMIRVYGKDVGGFHQLFLNRKSQIYLPDDIVDWQPQTLLHVVMHEASHASTVAALESFPALKAKATALMNHVNEFRKQNPKLFEFHDYAFQNEKEFIAEGQSKPGFQDALSQTPVSRELLKDIGILSAKNAWEALKQIIQEIWEKLTGAPVPKNAMDMFLQISKDIEQGQREVLNRGWIGVKKEGDLSAAERPEQLELPGLTRMEDRKAFEKAAALGMTEKQYRRYQELIAKRDSEDAEHFHQQAEKLERARQTAEWKAEESRIRDETKQQLRGRQDIAADDMFREGVYLGDKLKGRPRLDSDKLSAEQKSGLPDDYHKPGGVDPDDAAGMFGYPSADAMIQGLKQLHAERGELGPREHVNQLAEKITQARMRSEFGDLEKNILEEARDHVVSQTQLDILHEEMVALGSKFGGELSISKADVKSWVKKQFSEMPISMHSADDYLAAAGRAGRGAEQALLDGDGLEAFKFKQQQYISMQMANEAKAYEKARASFDRLAKRLAQREITNLPQDYVAHLRDQLLRAGLRIGRSVQALAEDKDKSGTLQQFVQRASDGAQVPILLPDWMYTDWGKKLDTMTAGEFSEFSKGIRQIYNFGRDEQKVIIGGQKLDLKDLLERAKAQLALQGNRDVPYNPSRVGKLIGLARNIFYGKLIQAETIFNRWDLGDPRGLFNEGFMYPFAAAANDLSARIKKYSDKVQEASKLIKDLNLRKSLPPLLTKVSDGQKVNMTVENALRIITDMGNPSNVDKFVRGWKVDPQALQEWLKANTTKEMWDFAQALGDVHEEIFGDLKNMIDTISGITPDRIALQPFTDPHGVERRGWYSPMIYDQVELGASRKLLGLPQIDPNEMVGLMDSGYFKSTTATGSEIQRTGYAAPTDLTLSRLPQRMTQILYDTAFRPSVINFGKVMRDKDFLNAITKHSGVEVRNMMQDWLRDIIGAGKGVSTASDLASGQVIEYFRRNIIGQLIGWNLHTVEKHGLSALVNSMAEVGMGNFAREFSNILRASPDEVKNNWDFALGKSEELQRRRQHWSESLGGQFEAVRIGGQGWRDWMLEKGSSLVAWSDMLSAVPSWLAEYKTQMAKLAEERPGDLPSVYEGIAISLADRAVRRAHGSTAITSRPGGMRGGAFARTFMSLYGFFNQMLQRNYEMMWRTKYAAENFKAGDYEKGWDNVRRAGVLFATATLWPALVEELVTPYTNEDRDSWGMWTAKTLALGMSATVPFVREFVHGWINNFETGAGILDTGWKELGSTFSDVRHGAKMMDAEHGGKTIKDLNALFGIIFGVTNNEVGNVMKTIWDSTHRSKETPRDLGETMKDVTTGHARTRR